MLGQDYVFTDFTKFDKSTYVLAGNPFAIPEAFSLLIFLISQEGEFYGRAYTKLQTLRASIGGVINEVFIIMKVLTHYLHNKIIMANLINQVIDTDDKIDNIFKKNDHIKSEIRNFKSIVLNSKIEISNLNQINQIHPQRKNKEYSKDNRGVRLSVSQLFCPQNCFKNKKSFYEESSNIIRHQLSVDNILRYLFRMDMTAEIVLNENDLNIIRI